MYGKIGDFTLIGMSVFPSLRYSVLRRQNNITKHKSTCA